MAAWDYQLLSKIILTGDLARSIDWGVTVDDMLSLETRSMFNRMVGYYNMPETAGSVWGPQALQQMFPNFPRYDDDSMTMEALCMEVRKARVEVSSRSITKQFEDMMVNDVAGAITYAAKSFLDLQNDCSPQKVDVQFADAFSRRLVEYQAIINGEQVSVAPWPWEPIQRKTLGIRPTDYIVIYGRPKSMKTWILCYLIAWMFELGLRILIYTKEMDPDEIFERVGCIVGQVDYERFTTGTLTPEEYAAVYAVHEQLQALRDRNMIICLSGQDARGKDTVPWIEAKVDKYQPHIIFVDGMYLLTDAKGSKRRNEKVANISMDMRQMILRKKRPVIATIQANRDAAKNEDANLEEVAFSDSVGQDATMLMRCINESKKGQETLALVMGGATRRIKLNGFRIKALPAYDFSYFGELTAREADRAVKSDDSEAGEAAGKKRKSTAKEPRPIQDPNVTAGNIMGSASK